MTLVIKNNTITLPEGEKLYRDPLVTEGSLYCIDFSNRGTTKSFNVKNNAIVFNLAREASKELNLEIDSKINTNNNASELTDKKGFSSDGITGNGAYGIQIDSLLDYLSNHNSNNIIFSMWVNTGDQGLSRGFMRSWGGAENFENTAFRANISSTGVLSLTIAGALMDTLWSPSYNSDARIAIQYQGIGNSLKVWVNGVYKGETTEKATGFNAIGHKIVIGKPNSTNSGNQAFYRMIVEDLTISERSAEDVVLDDYDYVNAKGKYLGIPKRPFANL